MAIKIGYGNKRTKRLRRHAQNGATRLRKSDLVNGARPGIVLLSSSTENVSGAMPYHMNDFLTNRRFTTNNDRIPAYQQRLDDFNVVTGAGEVQRCPSMNSLYAHSG